MRNTVAPRLVVPWIFVLISFTASCATGVRRPVHVPSALRVVTYNIKHGHGMDGAVDLVRVAKVLRRLEADVILLQEVDQGCARSGHVDQAAVLGSALGMDHRFAPFRPFDGGLYGMAILSRLPVLASAVVPLPPGPNPLAALELEIDASGHGITFTGLHLVQTEAQRLAQAHFLQRRYEGAHQPVVLAGDLNSERDSVVLAELSRDFDAPKKGGDQRTFPSVASVKEIDFILLSPKGGWTIQEHRVVPESVASDHRPVLLVASPESSPGIGSSRANLFAGGALRFELPEAGSLPPPRSPHTGEDSSKLKVPPAGKRRR